MHERCKRALSTILAGLLIGFGGCVFQVTDYRAEQGEPCDSGAQCVTGYCSHVCCDRLCDQPCEACTEDITGVSDGACAPLVLGDLDPDAPECDDRGGCGMNNQCGCDDGRLGPGELGIDCGGVCATECP